ncbi:MAG: insulinase family protein [Clostridiales bacterium]|jgi:Zn-dependent M16 (insulinase) family peptidase|nr:insulinase family protein [Clostridiales bacterium]
MYFKLEQSRALREIGAEGRFYSHPSGAALVHLKADDDNNVFAVAFKTPLSDNTGIAHAAEHCALCGSLKHPEKDPFGELARSSIYTYLNAITYQDFTIFPVASRSHEDFKKMAEVYLDGLFSSLIKDRPEIFLREVLSSSAKNGTLQFRGVAFSESKSIYSNPEERLKLNAKMKLFKDSPFAYSVAGTPEGMKNLTFEKTLDYIEKYYRPENCIFCLYGNMIEEEVILMIEEYLHKSENAATSLKRADQVKKEAPSEQDSEKTGVSVRGLSSEPSGDASLKGVFYSLGVIGDSNKEMAFKLLMRILAGDGAHLPRSFLPGSEPVEGILDLDSFTGFLGFISKAPAEQISKALAQSLKALKKISDRQYHAHLEGLKLDVIERKTGYKPIGLSWILKIIPCWANSLNPFGRLEPESAIEQLKKDKSLFLSAVSCLAKSPGVYADSSSPAPQEHRLSQLQEKHVAAEDERFMKCEREEPFHFNSIPTIKKSSLPKPLYGEPEAFKENGVSILNRLKTSNGIAYIDLYFDASFLHEKLIPLVYAARMAFARASSRLEKGASGIGRLSFASVCHRCADGGPSLRFLARGKCLPENAPRLLDLMREAITLDFNEADWMSIIEDSIEKLGKCLVKDKDLPAKRAASRFEESAALQQLSAGLECLEGLLSARTGACLINEARREILSKPGFSACISGIAAESLLNGIERMSQELPSGSQRARNALCLLSESEGLAAPSQVNCCAMAFPLESEYSAEMALIERIVSDGFMLDEIRAKGGAYDAGLRIDESGCLLFSHDDPCPERTFEAFRRIPEHLLNLRLSEKDVNAAAIAAMNPLLRIPHPEDKALSDAASFFKGGNARRADLIMEELFSAKPGFEKKFAGAFQRGLELDFKCSAGDPDLFPPALALRRLL